MGRLLGVVHRCGWRGMVAAAIISVGAAGCGVGSSEALNRQRVPNYASEVNKILAPFAHPANIATLRQAIAQVKELTPPTAFTKNREDLLHALEVELVAGTVFSATLHSKAPLAHKKAEAKNAEAASLINEALAEFEAELRKCEANNFAC
jgi:hypothetical protein